MDAITNRSKALSTALGDLDGRQGMRTRCSTRLLSIRPRIMKTIPSAGCQWPSMHYRCQINGLLKAPQNDFQNCGLTLMAYTCEFFLFLAFLFGAH
jgi:hypothetical protein